MVQDTAAVCIGLVVKMGSHIYMTARGWFEDQENKKSLFQPEFQAKYKKRAAHEWKNAEMKRFHGMPQARGWGLRGMTIQAKLTAIAVNLKRIAALVSEKNGRYPVSGASILRIGVLLPQFVKLDCDCTRKTV